MADIYQQFAQSTKDGMLTNIGGGIANLVLQKRANDAAAAKKAEYDKLLTQFYDTGDTKLIPQLQNIAPEKFEGAMTAYNSMDEMARKEKVKENMSVVSYISSGMKDKAAGKLAEMSRAYRADGDTEEADQLQAFSTQILDGDAQAVQRYFEGITGVIPEGQAALETATGLGAERRAQMTSDVQVAKTLDDLNITSSEQRERIGNALSEMPSGMGETLKQFLTVRTALDNGDMTLLELGKAEASLRAEFDDYTKPYRTIMENVTSMEAMLQDPTGAVDFGVIRMFNKALDPGSVVRESEAAGTAAATGLLDRLSAKMENIKEGDLIGADLRKDILEASKILQAGADENVSKQFNRLNETVKDFGYKDTRIWDKDDIEKYSNFSSNYSPVSAEPVPPDVRDFYRKAVASNPAIWTAEERRQIEDPNTPLSVFKGWSNTWDAYNNSVNKTSIPSTPIPKNDDDWGDAEVVK